MSRMKARYFFTLLLAIWAFQTIAQPSKKYIEVVVTPSHQDWNYKLGEQADFDVKILKNGQLVPGSQITFSIGLEQMEPSSNGTMELKTGQGEIKGMKLRVPGFVRCHVTTTYNGHQYSGFGTAAFEPEKIEPTMTMPEDFDAFWQNAKNELAKYPIDARLTLVPEECRSTYNVYHVSLQNINMPSSWMGVSRIYGMLSVPKKPGKYPAILNVPGAGVRAYHGDGNAANGVITFNIGIHGIPVNMPDEVYKDLATGALAGYQNYNLDDRDEYYYKRVYLGCLRAVDFIYSLPEFDGENLAVTGGSQGGALSIITAGLDKRIKYLAAFYPALADVTGYLHGRAGGWPHMFKYYEKEKNPDWVETMQYYDVVNFARKLEIPGWYSWGYDDNVCPPTSMFAAYNVITSPKELFIVQETEHWTYPEQYEVAYDWLLKKLKVKE